MKLLVHFSVVFHNASKLNAKTVDLGDRFGPIKEQGQTQFCHATVAADLLDFHFDNEIDNGVSFLDIALHISVRNPELSIFLDKYTLARHPDNSQLAWSKDGESINYAEAYPFGGRADIVQRTNYVSWAIYAYSNLNSRGQCKEKDLPSEDALQSLYFIPKLLNELKTANENKSLDAATIEDANYLMAQQLRSLCPRENIGQVIPHSLNLMELTFEQKKQAMMNVLDQGIPAGLSFNFRAVTEQASFQHKGTLIGYEIDNGTIIFKLRNSYGKNCRSDTYPVPKCRDGHLYIKDSDLIPHSNYLTWIPR